MINGGNAFNEAPSDAIIAPLVSSTSTSMSTSMATATQSTNDKSNGEASLASSQKDNEEWLELPEDFAPSKMDVIVGWARQNYHHGTYCTINHTT